VDLRRDWPRILFRIRLFSWSWKPSWLSARWILAIWRATSRWCKENSALGWSGRDAKPTRVGGLLQGCTWTSSESSGPTGWSSSTLAVAARAPTRSTPSPSTAPAWENASAGSTARALRRPPRGPLTWMAQSVQVGGRRASCYTSSRGSRMRTTSGGGS